MTFLVALAVLLTLPVFMALLKQNPRQRTWAFVVIGAMPFLTSLPLTGYLYGWANWSGTVRGMAISPIDTVAIALILTRRRTIGMLPFWGLFAFYAVPLLLSIAFASVWLATFFYCWQFGRMLLIFAAVGGEAHRLEVRGALLAGLALGLIFQAGYVIPQKLAGMAQANGTMAHQNILGLAIEQSIMPLVAALLAGSRRKIVIVGLVAAIICIAGTGSRGTVGIAGGAVMGLVLLSLARRITANKLKIVAMGVALLAAATPLAIASLNKRFQGASFVTKEDERASFEEAARAMSGNHPLGVGANNFVVISNRDGYAERAGVPWQAADRSMPVHNAYLLARAETGWWGELGFILLLSVPLLSALYFAFSDRRSPNGEVGLGVAMSIAANMIHNNFEYATHTFEVQTLLVLNVATVAALIRERRVEKRQRRRAAAARKAAATPPGDPRFAGA